MKKWHDHRLENGWKVKYSCNELGASIVFRGFWLHIPVLNWHYVQCFFEREFGRKNHEPEVVLILEPDNTNLMLGFMC